MGMKENAGRSKIRVSWIVAERDDPQWLCDNTTGDSLPPAGRKSPCTRLLCNSARCHWPYSPLIPSPNPSRDVTLTLPLTTQSVNAERKLAMAVVQACPNHIDQASSAILSHLSAIFCGIWGTEGKNDRDGHTRPSTTHHFDGLLW